MKCLYTLILTACMLASATAQSYSLDEINQTRTQCTRNGMLTFTTWTGVNLIGSTVGYFTTEGELKHFFEMNVYFNAINAAIAVPGMITAFRAKRTGLDFQQTVKEVQNTKVVYLVNGVLDISYITAGFWLREAGNNPSRSEGDQTRFKGFGSSLIMQGSFLLIYDFIAYGFHTANGKKLNEHWDKLTISPFTSSGMGINLCYDLSGTTNSAVPRSFDQF